MPLSPSQSFNQDGQQSSIESMFQGLLPGSSSAEAFYTSAAQQPSAQFGMSGMYSGMDSSMFAAQAGGSMAISDELKRLKQLSQGGSSNALYGNRAMAPAPADFDFKGGFPQSHMNAGSPSSASLLSSFNPSLASLSQQDAARSFLLMQQRQALQQQLQASSCMNMGNNSSVAGLMAAANKASLSLPFGFSASQVLPSPSSLLGNSQASSTAGANKMMRSSGNTIEPFPEKLMRMLLEVEASGRGDVISFVDGGRAFAIHKPNDFFNEIVPLYFRQSRLSSFKRQLNLYGFELISSGPSRGAYFHDLFQKDKPQLCRRMRRVAVKVAGAKRKLSGVKPEKDSQDSSKGQKDKEE